MFLSSPCDCSGSEGGRLDGIIDIFDNVSANGMYLVQLIFVTWTTLTTAEGEGEGEEDEDDGDNNQHV